MSCRNQSVKISDAGFAVEGDEFPAKVRSMKVNPETCPSVQLSKIPTLRYAAFILLSIRFDPMGRNSWCGRGSARGRISGGQATAGAEPQPIEGRGRQEAWVSPACDRRQPGQHQPHNGQAVRLLSRAFSPLTSPQTLSDEAPPVFMLPILKPAFAPESS
jgi:hypothetical protein